MGDQAEHNAAVQLFDTVFEQDAIGMALRAVGPHESRWLRVNQKLCDMLGYTRDELLQLTSVDVSVPDERHVAVDYNEQLLRGDIRSYSRDKRYLRKDGTAIWTNIWLSAVLDPDGNPTQIISVIQDISERVQAEEALRVSEHRYRALFENAAAGIGCSRIADGKLVLANRKLAEIFGYERVEQFVDEFSFIDHYVDPGERERLISLYEKGHYDTVEVSFTTRDGSVITVANQGWVDEKAGHIDFVMTDITERKRAEEQLRQAQKMEAVGQLTGGVAHDFNNLLAVIMGNTELLAEDAASEDPRIQAILRATRRGAELTQRLVAFSRRQPLKPQVIDLADLTTSMLELLSRTLGEIIDIETATGADLWAALADPGQVENAVLNLAINARDAMPKGGKLTIECVNARLDETYLSQYPDAVVGDYVVLALSDTGTGMSAEVQARACEPFFTTKEVGQGSGLGLSMAYGFAKQSGGHLNIYSEENTGTTVKLYLPRAEGVKAEAEAAISSMDIARGQGEVILVIEDDADVRLLTVRMLESLGYGVIDVPDAAEARDALRDRGKLDLILSDVVLPGGMSGPEFVEEALAFNPGLKAIFMSGYAAESAKRNGFLGSGKVLLNKPFQKGQLATVLREALVPTGSARPGKGETILVVEDEDDSGDA